MSKKRQRARKFQYRVVTEFTKPTKAKKLFMRTTFISDNMEVVFEGEMRETTRKKINELPKNYHVQYAEGTKKWYWYFIGRNHGKNDITDKRRYSKYEDAVKAAIEHNKSQK